MVALMWLFFVVIAATVQAQFPQPEHLEQFISHGKSIVTLKHLHIKKIPNNAFGNYPNITVRITK